MAIDYESYQASGGGVTQDVFQGHLPEAVAIVGQEITPNKPSDNVESYERAVFLAIDALNDFADVRKATLSNLASVRVGNTDLTFRDGGNLAQGVTGDPVVSIVRAALSGSGLLSRWLP